MAAGANTGEGEGQWQKYPQRVSGEKQRNIQILKSQINTSPAGAGHSVFLLFISLHSVGLHP